VRRRAGADDERVYRLIVGVMPHRVGTAVLTRRSQRQWFAVFELVETDASPAGRVGHSHVADLLLRERMAVVRLGEIGEQLFEEPGTVQRLPGIACAVPVCTRRRTSSCSSPRSATKLAPNVP
jgi:hypothetical protein